MADDAELNPELLRLSRKLQIDYGLLIQWLDNFQIDEQPYAMRLLENIKKVSEEEFKEICQEIYKKILEHNNLEDLIFVSIGKEAKSDKYISYQFRKYNGISEAKFINKLDPNLENLKNKTIIYLDDISGTGNQFCDDWDAFIKRFNKDFFQNNKFIFTPLFITEKAKRKIEEKTNVNVVFLEKNLLTEKNNVLFESAGLFEPEKLEVAKQIFGKYGEKLYPKGPLGYENLGLLLVFPYNTPNNTLPVIWGESSNMNFNWTPLFPRYESKKVETDKIISNIENIREKAENVIEESLSVEIQKENLRENENIKELDFRIKVSNDKNKTIENVVILAKAFRVDKSVLFHNSECYWNIGTINKTLNPGQVGYINVITLKILNNYWHISASYADNFWYGRTAGLGTIELLFNTVEGKKKDFDPFFPSNILIELTLTAKDMPLSKFYLMFQIYNCLFTVDVFFTFKKYKKEEFLKEIKIQQIVGTLSRSNLRLEPEEQHFKLLNELLPDDYEDYLPMYLERIDEEHHQKIKDRLKEIITNN